jgi:ParB family chromosome partitioning protein
MSSPPQADAKRRALGKGLEALLPARKSPQLEAMTAPVGGSTLEVALDQIERNPYQTRTQFDDHKLGELASSIAASGVIQPVVLRPLPGGRYQLITGERRWLASRRAGKNTIPAIVRQANDAQAMEMTIVENLQRADLNPIEQARAYHRLSEEFRMTQEQMAIRTGKDRASVSNYLRLLRLPASVQQLIQTGVLSMGHAKALLAIESPARIEQAAERVQSLALSVRQTETYVGELIHPEEHKAGKKAAVIEPTDPNVREAQDRLQRSLGLKVKIEDRKGRGRVIIQYSGLEDFDVLLTALDRKLLPDMDR